MLPTSFSTSSSSSSSSSSATVRVEKATSDLLIGPDWTLNIEICDSINSNHWQAKDVVKAVKRRLQHKSPNVQLLSLTLLETMVKNCGEFVHFQITEKNILQDMVKFVRKRADMRVREKILLLLDSWQEAFGGPGGRYPQYYWAYDELRRSGVQFPQRSSDAAPIFTPPISHPAVGHPQAGYGMPGNSSRRLDEAMASEIVSLSLSNLDSMRDVTELLNDMLQAVNPSDRVAIKDELIVDLVSQCRSNQKKLMQMITSTGDEELLSRGLDLNDSLQNVLAKHDAIATGLPMPSQALSFSPQSTVKSSVPTQNEETSSNPRPNISPPAPVGAVTGNQIEEEEEEDDDFSLLARRHSKPGSVTSQTTSSGTNGVSSSLALSTTTPDAPVDPIPSSSNALALPDPPAPVRTSKEQDIIDLLSITLSTASTSPHTPHTGPNIHQAPISPSRQGYHYGSQPHAGNQGQVPYNSYVVPWAQPQPQSPLGPQYSQPQAQPQQLQPRPQQQQQQHAHPTLGPQFPQYSHPQAQLQQQQPQIQSQQPQYSPQSQPQPQPQPHPHPHPQAGPQYPQYSQAQAQPQLHPQPLQQPHPQVGPQYPLYSQPQAQPQLRPQPQVQAQQPQYSPAYPPPPWATTPGYTNNQIPLSTSTTRFASPQANATGSSMPTIGGRTLQSSNSFSARGSDGSVVFQGNSHVGSNPSNTAPAGQKTFIPSYRLFEDLDVFGSSDGRVTNTTPASLLGPSGSGVVGGRK